MATGNVAVETLMRTSLFVAGVGSALNVDRDVDAAVIIRGGGGVVGLFHCSLWMNPVSDEGKCCWI